MDQMGTYIDIALIVIAGLAFIIGLAKGLVKQLSKLLSGFISFVGAVALTAIIIEALKNTTFFFSFATTTSSWFSGEVFTATVAPSAEAVAELLNNSGAWRILAFMSETFASNMATLEFTTLGQLFGYLVAVIITAFVIWLVLYIALKFIIKGIKSLLLKLVHLPVIKTIDKVLGAIWGVFVAYCIFIVILLTGVEVVFIKFFPADTPEWQTVQEFIASSKILCFANNTNVIGSWIAESLEVTLPVLGAQPTM